MLILTLESASWGTKPARVPDIIIENLNKWRDDPILRLEHYFLGMSSFPNLPIDSIQYLNMSEGFFSF